MLRYLECNTFFLTIDIYDIWHPYYWHIVKTNFEYMMPTEQKYVLCRDIMYYNHWYVTSHTRGSGKSWRQQNVRKCSRSTCGCFGGYTPEDQHGTYKSPILERKMIFQISMIMVHVNLPGCTEWTFCLNVADSINQNRLQNCGQHPKENRGSVLISTGPWA